MFKALLPLFAALCLAFPGIARAQFQAPAFPPELEADLSAGTSATYLLDFEQAERHFRRAIALNPEHPAAYFFSVMLTWYRLTYDSLVYRNPQMEKVLEDQADLAVEKAKRYAGRPATEAVGRLYWGGALGAKGWYHVTRSQWVRAYLSGKKGYDHIRRVIEIDPYLYDAYLGIGMFEYYAATLGPTLRVLASFAIRGDRETALRHLRLAEEKSRFVRLEAAYFLWNAAWEEDRVGDAMELARFLKSANPASPLFHWCEISTAFKQKRWQEVLRLSEEFADLSQSGPQPEGYRSPFDLLLSKVYYHCGMSAYYMGNIKLAKAYFERAIDQPAEFQGWRALAYLRRGELFDLEGKRLDALGKYKVVLKLPDAYDSHKTAKKRIKTPYRLQ